MLAFYIRRKVGQTGNLRANRTVYFQVERVGHLRQRLPRPHPFQDLPALCGQHTGARAVCPSVGLGLVGAPPLLCVQQQGHVRLLQQPGLFLLDPHGPHHFQ
jgi:hypothetical protein